MKKNSLKHKEKRRLAALLSLALAASTALSPVSCLAATGYDTGIDPKDPVGTAVTAYQTYDTISTAVKNGKAAGEAASEAASGAAGAASGAKPSVGQQAGAGLGIASDIMSMDFSDPGSVMKNTGDIISNAQTLGVNMGSSAAAYAEGLSYIGSVFGQKISDSMTYRSIAGKVLFTCQSSTPSPTINEKVTVNCEAAPAGGADYVVPPAVTMSKTPTKGGKDMMISAPVIAWKCGQYGCYPVGGGSAEVEFNAYEGDVTMGGDMFFNPSNWDGQFATATGQGGGNDFTYNADNGLDLGDGSLTNSVLDYYTNMHSSDPDIYGSGVNTGNGPYGFDANGNPYGVDGNGNQFGGFDANGNPIDINGNPFNPGTNGNNGGYNYGGGGYYDNENFWHEGNSGSGGHGYYDWGGENYSSDLNNDLHDSGSAYNAGGGDWSSSTGGAGGGYYDSEGNWHSGTNPYDGGHYDSDGNWVSGGGYYDENGTWHDGTNPYEGGHYNSDGSWTDGTSGGYYDSNGNWHEGGTASGGYYDSDGNWHEGSPYGTDNLDGYFNGSGSGNDDGYGSFGMTGDITGFDANASTVSALEALANGGYVGEDGIIYDAEGNAWGSAQAAGLIPMEEGSEQLNNVLAQGGWIDERGNVYDANGNIVGYVVPAGSLGSGEGEAFEDSDMFAKSNAMLQEFLNYLNNSNNGEGSLMERIAGGPAEGSLLAALKSTFGMSDSEDVRKETMTPQQMYDAVRDLLKELGYSDEDIAKGLNYDKNSAYTEPDKAWDMNRITTMQKTFKIDTHIRLPEENKGNAISGAADRFGNVKAATAPNPAPAKAVPNGSGSPSMTAAMMGTNR